MANNPEPRPDQDGLEPPESTGSPGASDPWHHVVVPEQDAGQRLDAFLAAAFPQFSRVQLRRAINGGQVEVEGSRAKASHRLRAGDRIRLQFPERTPGAPLPEPMPLEILYEDDILAAVNKPPGVVVHPAKGHWSGTLASGLAHHFQQLSSTGGSTRPGIVHRLDRDTSGVLVVAKTDAAHLALSAQFADRTTEKEYFALVRGRLDRDRDVVEQPIGPHPHHRERMAIRPDHPASRPARTFYEVVERFPGFVAVRVLPKTGRTHQIRLHLAHAGAPVLCDRLYAGHARITAGELANGIVAGPSVLERQALHAARLVIQHPGTGQRLEFSAPLPADIQRVLELLRELRDQPRPGRPR